MANGKEKIKRLLKEAADTIARREYLIAASRINEASDAMKEIKQ